MSSVKCGYAVMAPLIGVTKPKTRVTEYAGNGATSAFLPKAFLAAIAAGNVLFNTFGGHWVILPLIFVAGFVTHAFTVHAYWTVRRNTYSTGLLMSTLYIVIFYLLIRYGLGGHLISGTDFAIGTIIGIVAIGAFLTVGPTVLFPGSCGLESTEATPIFRPV
jgi:uncharacterized membrane protein YjjP (DUF1212 family)